MTRSLLFAGLLLSQPAMAYYEAFPQTEVDTFAIKTLPAGMVAVAATGTENYFTGSGDSFRKLFRYISRRDIEMTVPVEATIEPGTMTFWIAPEETAKATGATDDVELREIPERTVASLGIRGSYSEENFLKAKTRLEEWLATHPDYEPTGPASMVYWNSPMVPWFLKRSEIHIPVTPRH